MRPKSVPFGQYDLTKRIARGGMAEIFLAIERGIEGVRRRVVVKRILPHMAESDDFVTMFMDEARVVARISHPNIVHIYNFGEVDGVYFIAMEFVDGLTISRLQRLAKPKSIPYEYSLRVMADICSGLHAAHELTDEYGQLLGVIHRDVSPQNILVSKNGIAKLIDFGVARASTQAHSTQAGQIKGKLGYIAPEQFHRKIAMDRRADVFSAGTVLYELITGERLFVRETEAATLNAIINEEPPSFHGGMSIPDPIDAIIRKAVQKSPSARFSTAAEMQHAIESLLIHEGFVVTPSVIGEYVAEHLKKALQVKNSRSARVAAEGAVPTSYPSEVSRRSESSWSSEPSGPSQPSSPSWQSSSPSHSSSLPTHPSFDQLRAELEQTSNPSLPQQSSDQSSFPTSGVTPTPASDVSRRRGHRSLWVAVVCVGAMLLLGIGVYTGLSLQESNDTGLLVANDTSPTASSGGERIRPVPIAPDDLLPPSKTPRVSPVVGPSPQLNAMNDGGTEDGTNDGTNDGIETGPSKQTPVAHVARPRGKGTLFLNSRPWCKVRVGGRSLGTTPIINVELPAGLHVLQLTDANGQRHRRSVRIRPDRPTKLFLNLDSDGK